MFCKRETNHFGNAFPQKANTKKHQRTIGTHPVPMVLAREYITKTL